MMVRLATSDGRKIEPAIGDVPATMAMEVFAFAFYPGGVIATHNGKFVKCSAALLAVADCVRDQMDAAAISQPGGML